MQVHNICLSCGYKKRWP